MIATSAGQPANPQQGSTAPVPGQTQAQGQPKQPQKDPKQFAQGYAAVVQDVIDQHKQYRIPTQFDQLDQGAQSMALNAPGRAPDYTS
jgi:hypothetical protein